MSEFILQKKKLRIQAQALRKQKAAYSSFYNSYLLAYLRQYLEHHCSSHQWIAGFWPLPGEVDLRPMMNELVTNNYRFLLPKTSAKGFPLTFHCWLPNEPLYKGLYGTRYPDTEEKIPDWLIVPLLGFDKQGNRLGYGGGYYDRTLACLPQAKTIGVAFSFQEFDYIPTEPFDYSLPCIITEKGILETRKHKV